MKSISDDHGLDRDRDHKQATLGDYSTACVTTDDEVLDDRPQMLSWRSRPPSTKSVTADVDDTVIEEEAVGIPHGCRLQVRQEDIDAYVTRTRQ